MAKNSSTIRDVAELAGVGVGTVSRVLNESPSVSAETRRKVLAAIEELNYRPSSVARLLSSGGKSLAIGLIVPFFTRPAFVERLRGIEASLVNSPYNLVLYNVETPEHQQELFERVPYEQRVDGVIVMSLYPSDADVERFARYNLPVVLVDAYHPQLPSLTIDDINGGRLATQYLIDLGHTRIAYLSDDIDSPFRFRASARRLQGYQQALTDNGIPFNPEYHKQGEHGRYRARHLTTELLDLDDPPTAIFTASDTQALGTIEAIRSKGLNVPGDVSVIGYDDITISSYIGLTTISQSLYETGIRGVRAMLKRLDQKNAEVTEQVIPVSLVVRETAAPLNAATV
nr:LacI family DNA-binding transcriptional regulator [Anaerolineae bacterium]